MKEENQKPEFILYKRRYLICFVFILGQIATNFQFSTTMAIAEQMTIIFNIPPYIANLSTLLTIISIPIGTLPATYFLDKYGLAIAIRVGAILLMAAACMRFLVNYSFLFVVLASIFVGIANPFLINGLGKIGANWFPPSARQNIPIIILISTLLANTPLGLVPGIIFQGYQANSSNQEYGKLITYKLFLVSAIITFVLLLIEFLFIQNNPPTPPTSSSILERKSFQAGMRSLLNNFNYYMITVSFSLVNGGLSAFGAVLSFVLKPYNFTATEISIIYL
jgi:hypothetical protein